MSSVLIPARFNGPARSANGGFACGTLAEQVPGSERSYVEVTLRQPPPMETPMEARTADGVTVLTAGDRTIAEARPVEGDLEPVDAVPSAVAVDAMLRYPGLVGHPVPTCFACGPDRAPGDGLRIFATRIRPGVV
ncbi:MAG: hypothetical protein HOQ22_09625, partial [Nocardioidaceae bacterium]|nr:hypothetical protein [Nocardioidaceae bacterium]